MTAQIVAYTKDIPTILQSVTEEDLVEPHRTILTNAKVQEMMENMNKLKEALLKVSLIHAEFYIALFTFKLRYGHLFKYNFEGDEFKKLVTEGKTLSDEVNNAYNKLNLTNRYDASKIILGGFLSQLAIVINNLMREIEAYEKDKKKAV